MSSASDEHRRSSPFTSNANLLSLLSFVLLIGESALTALIIHKVAYTEIDWKAYMQEVEGYLNGETDYYNLKGDTGPLVYPAGFVYLYSVLYHVTNQGTNIELAQWIFLGLYVAFVFVVHRIYLKCFRVMNNPSLVNGAAMLVLLSLSRRVHSLFVLRLFNDCFAMFFLYVSVYLFMSNRWGIGCFFYSLGVSIKMNVLLFAPGLLTLLLFRFTLDKVLRHLIICAMVQWVLALPFITTFPISYLHRSFELGRQFMYKWSTNWKMLPEEIFLSKPFAIGLLAIHVSLLLFLAFKRWVPALREDLVNWEAPGSKRTNIASDLVVKVLFTANFVGIACARSLHYQFYVWYFHSVPFLLLFLAFKRWVPALREDLVNWEAPGSKRTNIASDLVVKVLFTANFVGIACARSLHYQFYVWYFHSVPFLLFSSPGIAGLSTAIPILMTLVLEICWNIYPATAVTSSVMLCVHILTVLGFVADKSFWAFVPYNSTKSESSRLVFPFSSFLVVFKSWDCWVVHCYTNLDDAGFGDLLEHLSGNCSDKLCHVVCSYFDSLGFCR
eukprot:TRINITY_DN1300_c0_g2_i2.p1 TRINITY_DN1300_c0_g2~~TRINITY_DN1300_c0_g2_i2.p1  ORF type:complete len:555 (-),score=125.41 TRINITY_DN1300_c0_g2_i2:80-1744(-)